MTTQHYRLTLDLAIAHYLSGSLTAKGLVHFYILIKCAPGWTLKKTQKEICEELGIGRTAFYNALSRLKAEGAINWSVPEQTEFSISLPVRECGQRVRECGQRVRECGQRVRECGQRVHECGQQITKTRFLQGSGRFPKLFFKFLSNLSQLSLTRREREF